MVSAPAGVPTSSEWGSFSSTSSPCLIADGILTVVSRCSFDLHFPNSEVDHLFIYLLILVCLLGTVQVPCPFLIGLFVFLMWS